MLQIQVKATNITLTPEISDYIEKKVRSLEKLIDPNDTSSRADVEIQKTTNHHQDGSDLFRAEVNLRVGKLALRAENSNHDLTAAIDNVKDELHRELTTQKRKTVHMIRKGGQIVKNILKGIESGGKYIKNFRKK
jgi:putative sigma-54 modulation protein